MHKKKNKKIVMSKNESKRKKNDAFKTNKTD